MNIFAALKLVKLVPRMFKAGEDVQTKGWYGSKTIWFNLLVLAADIAAKVFGQELPVTGEGIDAIAAGLCAVGNIVLRFGTSKPVGMQTRRQGQTG